MAVDAIGVVQDTSNTMALGRNGAISQANFLQLLLAQLKAQDPMNPPDNTEFVAQLASFSALELERQSNEGVQNLLTVQAIAQSVGLIGKKVALQQSNSSGTVTALSIVNGEPRLTLDNNFVGVRPSDVVLVQP